MSDGILISMAEAARQCHTTIKTIRKALEDAGVRLVPLNSRMRVYQSDLDVFKKEAGYID